MKLIVWNSRGLSYAKFRRTVREMVKVNRPDVLCITEAKFDETVVKSLSLKLKFSSFFTVSPQGLASGLALFWNAEKVDIDVLDSSEQCIHTAMVINSIRQVFSFVYVKPSCVWKDRFWVELKTFAGTIDSPWYV